MKSLLITSVLICFFLYSCNKKESNTPQHQSEKLQGESGMNYSWKGKSASFVDVNNFDAFLSEDYGQIDFHVVEKLLTGVVKGDLKAVKDDQENTSLSSDEVIQEIRSAYKETIQDTSKTDKFIKIDGYDDLIPVRDIFQLVTKDECYFDEQTYSLIRKTKKVAIVFQTYDTEGWERGRRIGFWIILDKTTTI